MSEIDLVRKMIKHLRAQGFFATKIHGGPMQQVGLPDIMAVKNGCAFFFEVKLPGGQPTNIQQAILGDLQNAGAVAACVHSIAELDVWI